MFQILQATSIIGKGLVHDGNHKIIQCHPKRIANYDE
jgi:hypothetical protein